MSWQHISISVSEKIFANNANLFKDINNKLFNKLLHDAFNQVEFKIEISQKSLLNSEGYRQYCSQLLKQSGFFAAGIQKQCEKIENQHRGISHVPSL